MMCVLYACYVWSGAVVCILECSDMTNAGTRVWQCWEYAFFRRGNAKRLKGAAAHRE